jgi:ribonuclease P protein component
MRSGHRRRTPRLDISWRANDLGHPRLAVVVPRHGHSVVERNRLRRRVREIARRHVLRQLAPLDLVIRSRPGAYESGFEQLAADMDKWAVSLSG